mmetsp:Transcript_16958/g.37028  ORF Transcript_16958/g.37028 Transcript_16958/m.37028 type:complete len:358 (+) Transcript_16958:1113-2186(+)
MKYLQDDQLVHWTTAMTDMPIGNSRILNGRLEAYSMKRATSDKKYAAVLGEKYVEQIQQDQDSMVESSSNNNNNNILVVPSRGRKRSQSVGVIVDHNTKEKTVEFSLGSGDAQPSNNTTLPPKKRSRSCSLDEGLPKPSLTALGDFNEQGTRRLMTDLVLTLNASFPDYDFSSIKPTDFVKFSVKKAIRSINESLSEWSSSSSSSNNSQTSVNNLNQMWHDVDQAISLNECEVYKFIPPEDASFLLPTYDYEEEEAAASYDNSAVIIPETMEDGSGQQAILWSFSYLFVNKPMKRIVLFSCAESMRQQSASAYSDDDEENGEDRFVQFVDARGAAGNLDFDLDPESNTAGGIPISTI